MRASTNNGSGSAGEETIGGTSANGARVSAGCSRFSLRRPVAVSSLRAERGVETRASDTRRFVGEVDAFVFFGLDFTARRRRVLAAAASPLRPGPVVDAARFKRDEVAVFRVVFAAGFGEWPRRFGPTTFRFPTVRFDEDFPWDFGLRAVAFEEEDARGDFILLQYRPRERSSLSPHRTRCTLRRRARSNP